MKKRESSTCVKSLCTVGFYGNAVCSIPIPQSIKFIFDNLRCTSSISKWALSTLFCLNSCQLGPHLKKVCCSKNVCSSKMFSFQNKIFMCLAYVVNLAIHEIGRMFLLSCLEIKTKVERGADKKHG